VMSLSPIAKMEKLEGRINASRLPVT